MRNKRSVSLLVVAMVFMGAAVLWLKSSQPLRHDAPRHLPWSVPDYHAGKAEHSVLSDGRIEINITHMELTGIRPEMLAWWYRNLPISTVDIDGTHYTFYHVFHPVEHGRIRVLEPASDGAPGMGEGALVEREEWFGPFDSKGAGRITQFSSTGMTIVPVVAGLRFGEIQHRFESTASGTRYRVKLVIGVQWPLIGEAVNAAIRHTMYSEPMLKEWERHQIEEVGMLQHFLATLYNSQPQGNRYRLESQAFKETTP